MSLRTSRSGPARKLALLALCVFTFLLAFDRCHADAINFVEKPWDQLPNHDVGDEGQLALSVRPNAWLHGESPNWILHYRRITEAKRVALEIDFHMNFVSKTLGAKPDQIAHKANVFIFEDDKDWKEFMAKRPPDNLAFAASFATGENLFLNVRNGTTGMFNSQILAHETTHAIVARIFHRNPPLWLSEGFAEEMSGRSTGARMGQYNQRLLQHSQTPPLSVDQLVAIREYPQDLNEVYRLYENSEKLVRFLMTNTPPEPFQKLFGALLEGEDLPTLIPKYCGNKFPTYAAFTQAYARLPK